MKISFCTTCCNRLYQFSNTIDINYEVIKNNKDTEWVIVNYNSTDETHGFLTQKLQQMSNRVVYVNEYSGRKWHASVAKNVAHVNATGDVLVNLDCDNFIGNSLNIIREKFSKGTQVLHMWSGTNYDGTYGRIAITKELFHKINGYDERMYPMGAQDDDLKNRAAKFGGKYEKVYSLQFTAIVNTKEDSIKNSETGGMSWYEMSNINRETMLKNIKDNILVANMPNGMSVPKMKIYRGTLNI